MQVEKSLQGVSYIHQTQPGIFKPDHGLKQGPFPGHPPGTQKPSQHPRIRQEGLAATSSAARGWLREAHDLGHAQHRSHASQRCRHGGCGGCQDAHGPCTSARQPSHSEMRPTEVDGLSVHTSKRLRNLHVDGQLHPAGDAVLGGARAACLLACGCACLAAGSAQALWLSQRVA